MRFSRASSPLCTNPPSERPVMHRYRSHTCGALRESDIGAVVRLSGWVHRVRDHGGAAVYRPARPLRLDPGRRRPRQPGLQGRRKAALGMGGAGRRQGPHPSGRNRKSRPAHRHGRSVRDRDRGVGPGGRIADAGIRRSGISGGHPAPLSLPRSAARAAAHQHHEARRDHRFDPPAHEGGRLLRIPDPDPDRIAHRKARGTIWSRRVFIPASSTRCRRPRSNSSS